MVRFARFIRITSFGVIAVALLVLVGWQLNITAFTTILPGLVGMNPYTALGFIAVACWQMLYKRPETRHSGPSRVLRLTLALFVLLLGGLRLVDIATGSRYSFDNLTAISQLPYGFISPLTAFLFLIFAAVMLPGRVLRRVRNLDLVFLTPVLLLSSASLFGYAIGDNNINTLKPFKPMALHTTICFVVLTVNFLLLFPRNVFTRTALEKDLGGFVARRLLPFIIIVPLVLGIFSYRGYRAGLYDAGFGMAIVVVGALFVFLAVVMYQARQLSIIDQKRTAAEQKVRQHTREVEAANRALEQRNKEQEQFTYVSHHDLQEPLRKIIMYTDMVQTEAGALLPGTARERLAKVNAAALRMREALKDVLEFASLDKEEAFKPVDLDKVLQTVLSDLELVIHEKGATIKAGPLPLIRGVPAQMHQLFYNLVSNALKFAKKDVPPVVVISCEKKGDDPLYEICIADNGIGFKPAAAENIFILFQRLHSKDAYPGTGIGLALCKKVVQKHGGTIWAESLPGEGATFHVQLPAGSQMVSGE